MRISFAAWAQEWPHGRPLRPATGLLREQLPHGVTHVGHYLDGADLAVLELDAVLGRDGDLFAGGLGGMPAIGTLQDTPELDPHAVGDDEAIFVFADVDHLNSLAEVGEGVPLAADFPKELGEGQVGVCLPEVGAEPGNDQLLCSG
jgi:hypothetical protein